MSLDWSIQLAVKDSAWFTANPTHVLLLGQKVYKDDQSGLYKLGDGVTQLSALSFLGNSVVEWGNITGTVTDQTDLITYLVANYITQSSTSTLTNKRITPRVTTITSSATPTINTDNCDAVTITALATAITSMTTNLTGTPNNFDKLIFRIKDNGTARAITWGASFEAKGVSLPTTTVISKALTVGFIYDAVTSKWGCVASAQEA